MQHRPRSTLGLAHNPPREGSGEEALSGGGHHNRRGMGGHRRREVPNNNDAFSKIKFKIPPFDGKYDPDAYISWEIDADQKFACHEFHENTHVRAATSEFTDFATVGG